MNLLEQLKVVLTTNCEEMLYIEEKRQKQIQIQKQKQKQNFFKSKYKTSSMKTKDTHGTHCIDHMLDILFKLHNNEQLHNNDQLHTKHQLPDALPLLEKYLKTADYTKFNKLHFHLLRAVVLNLDNYVAKYNKGFLINLFMNMEEQAITGIYFLQKNGTFADNRLMAEFQKYPIFSIVFNELSNTAIIMMLNSKKKSINTKTPGFRTNSKKYTARRRAANTRAATNARKTKRNTTAIQKKIKF
jgi:hypothetical protein